MGKTTLTNKVGFNVQVKEGNSNIFRNLQVLHKGESMTITADSSATYREFVLILLPNNEKLRPLTSDDIQELSAVEIFKDEDGKFDWRESTEKRSWFSSVIGLFSKNSGAKGGAKADASAAESSKSPTATQ